MDIFGESFVEKLNADPALNMLLMGVSHSGKSTSIGTYSGRRILYITTAEESHGAQAAMKYNADLVERKQVKPCKFVHVNLGTVQEIDIATELIKKDQLEVGAQFPKEHALSKLEHYLNVVAPTALSKGDVVVVDSLTSIHNVLTRSLWMQKACESTKGKHDHFAENKNIGVKYSEIVESFGVLNAKGIDTIAVVLAKMTGFKENEEGRIIPVDFAPSLPTVGIAESLKARFDTTCLMFRSRHIANNRPFLHFGISGSRTSRSWNDGSISNHTEIDLRVQYLPIGNTLDRLPADWENLKENVIKYSKPPE